MKRLTQRESIANARAAYIIPTNAARSRFQVYLLGDNGLELLYPDKNNKNDRLYYQRVQTSDPSKPMACFALGGTGYSKTDTLAKELREYNSDLQVEVLDVGFAIHGIRTKKQTKCIDEFESGMYPADADRNHYRLYSIRDSDNIHDAIRITKNSHDETFSLDWEMEEAPDEALQEQALEAIAKAGTWENAERIANIWVQKARPVMDIGPVYTGALHP